MKSGGWYFCVLVSWDLGQFEINYICPILHVFSTLSKGLTAWVASEDISSAFIIQEDEEGVGEGTEPPAWPKV